MSELRITKEEVLHVARLARLELTEDELHKFTDQMDSILSWMDKLASLDTKDVEPTYHALDNLSNVLRKDEPGDSLSQHSVLANAPSREGGFFKVPRIVDVEE